MPTNADPVWEDTSPETPTWEETTGEDTQLETLKQVVPPAWARTQPGQGPFIGAPFAPREAQLEEVQALFRPVTTGMKAAFQAGRGVSAELMKPIREGMEQVMQPVSDLAADFLRRQGVAAQAGEPLFRFQQRIVNPPGTYSPPTREFLQGLEQAQNELLSGLTEPGMLTTLPFAAGKPVQAMFAGQVLSGVPEQLEQVAQARTPGEFGRAGGGLLATGLIGGGLARSLAGGGRLPRTEQELAAERLTETEAKDATKEVRVEEGGIRQYPKAEEGGIPPKTGGGDRTEQPAPMEKPEEVLLSPEDQAHIDAERGTVEAGVELQPELGGEQPFARMQARGDIATIDRARKKILINPAVFKEWLASIPHKTKALAVRSLLNEEQIHLKVDDASALAYWNSLTAAEKAIALRRYTGYWTARGLKARRGVEFSDKDMGHEALRFQLQRAARMSPREFVEAGLKERIKLETYTALEDALRTLRDELGTKASEEQLKILSRMQENVNSAIVAAGGQPAAWLKDERGRFLEGEEPRPEEYTDKDILLTVMKWDDPRMPRIVQADSTKGGVNEWSSNPGELKRVGFDIPDEAELVDKLPAGQYTLAQARQMMADKPPGTVRLYHGEGAVEGAGAGGTWWTTKPDYAALFGKVSYVDVPPEVAREAQARVRAMGEGGDNYILPQEWVGRSDVMKDQPKPKVYEIEEGPAAFRKGEKKGQPELALPPTEQAPIRPSAPPAAPRVPTPAPAAKGPAQLELTPQARPLEVTPFAIDRTAYRLVTEFTDELSRQIAAGEKKPTAPSYKEFVNRMEQHFGERLSKGQVAEVWEKVVWTRLNNASGEVLEQLRDALKLRAKVGERDIANPPATREPLLKVQLEGEAKAAVREETKVAQAAQNYRATVIRAIGTKLMEQAVKERRPVTRKELEVEDIGFERAKAVPAFLEIEAGDRNNPAILDRLLTDEAREFNQPVSNTKRLTVMQNRETGQVSVVSTFRDGRRGTVLLDPASGKHAQLTSILERYRPIYSILLDEPVKDFEKRYASLGEFEDKFATEAKKASSAAIAEPTAPEGEFMAGPTTGRYAIPGVFQGGPGAVQRMTEPGLRLEPEEATAILDHLISEVDKVDSPADVKSALMGLEYSAAQGTLTAREWSAISGYSKIYDAIRAKFPKLEEQQVMEQLAEEIYDKASKREDLQDFIGRTLEDYSPEVGKAFREIEAREAAPTTSPTAKELTLPRFARKSVPTTPESTGPPTSALAPPPPHITEMLPELKAIAEKMEPDPNAPAIAQAEKAVEQSTPAAFRKQRQQANDLWDMTKLAVAASVERRQTKQMLAQNLDGVEGSGAVYSKQAGDAIRIASGSGQALPGVTAEAESAIRAKKIRTAAFAVIATGVKDAQGVWRPRRHFLVQLRQKISAAHTKATHLSGMPDPRRKIIARKWHEVADKWKDAIDFAEQNWNEQDLKDTVSQVRQELHNEILWEQGQGSHVTERENYTPNIYEGEFWADNTINFGPRRLFGLRYQRQRVFDNYFEAIAAGPYFPATMDIAELVEHRIGMGRRNLARNEWAEGLKITMDRASLQPIAKEAVPIYKDVMGTDPDTGQPVLTKQTIGYKSPDPFNYEPVKLNDSAVKPLYIRSGYKHLVSTLLAPSKIELIPLGKEAIIMTQALKHGVMLIMDTFHLGRLSEYTAALLGKQMGYNGGYSALNYRASDLPEAVRQGYISQAAADWATATINITDRRGNVTPMTRQAIAMELIGYGLNAAKITDALYKDAVQNIPLVGEPWHKLIGPYNRWLFDRFVPGVIVESAVRHFEKYNKANPGIPVDRLMRDIARDINIFYGNMGRQGIFKSATFRDLAQLTFLAPMWQEGLFQKEIRSAFRLAGAGARLSGLDLPYRRGLPAGGVLGYGMARGLTGFFILTQLINLATRRQFTWDNPEKGHKLDAWVPTGEEGGFWISPMAVFAEVTHDLIRLSETKRTVREALMQMGENRMGPLGKMEQIFRTGESPTGERYTTTAATLGAMAKQLAPMPIAFGTPGQALLHQAFPMAVSPPAPGQLQRQVMASLTGIKVQPGLTALQEASRRAQDWLRENGLEKESTFMEPTDQPSYSKLRTALRNDDPKVAKKVLAYLRERHSDQEIIRAMKTWSKQPLTGNKKYENRMRQEFTDAEGDTYSRAQEQRQRDYMQFLDFIRDN